MNKNKGFDLKKFNYMKELIVQIRLLYKMNKDKGFDLKKFNYMKELIMQIRFKKEIF